MNFSIETKEKIQKKDVVSTKKLIKIVPETFQWALLISFMLVSDFLMVGFGFRFAYWIRFQLNLPFFVDEAFASPTYYQGLVVLIIPTWILIFLLAGLYKQENLLGGVDEYNLLFSANTISVLTVVAVGFFKPDLVFARGWVIVSWISTFFYTALGRFMIRRGVYFLRTKNWFLTNSVIIGFNDEASSMAEQLQFVRKSGLRLLGFVDCHVEPGKPVFKDLKCLGNIKDLDTIISKFRIKELILTSSALDRDQVLNIYKVYGMSDQISLHMSSGVYEIITTGMKVKEFAWVPLVEVNKVRLTGLNLNLKLLMDYGLTIPGLILISPLLLLISLIIKLDDHGPILHRRTVMGVNGKTFDAFKFRTMAVNGDEILKQFPEKLEELERTHKIKDDPRITKFGKLLRKASLDELPQLFNVLRNEMSLVGPRMISPEEMIEYQKWGMNLLTVKPGITGKWQVSGRSDLSYQQRVNMDMYYIRNWSIWLDIQLLIQTLPAILSKRGAY
jgi:exopolysaccharide biosynthesis polyprenyl glycosylphosphotransferase